MYMSKGLLSMESVGFQNDIYFKELTKAFGKIIGKENAGLFIDAALEIQAIAKHHTNMTIKVNFDSDFVLGGYMMIPELTNTHVLLSDGLFNPSNSDGLRLIRKAKKAVSGSLNTKTGWVDGVFAEYECNVHFGRLSFKSSVISAEEWAGIFLHEQGHIFVYFEFLSREATTNQILAGVVKSLEGNTQADQKEYILTEVSKSVGLGGVDVKELAKTQDDRVLYTVLIAGLRKEYASEVGYDIYSTTSNEALADQYASRFGASKAMVTGLDKIYRMAGSNISYRTTVGYLAVEAMKVSMLLIMPVFLIAGGAATARLSFWVALIGLSMILEDATEIGLAATYDTPGDRYRRLRNDMVERLKSKSMTKEEVAAITGDIAAIDLIIKSVNDRRQFFGVIQDILTSKRRFNRDMKLLQQSLERLVANDVFVSATKMLTAVQA